MTPAPELAVGLATDLRTYLEGVASMIDTMRPRDEANPALYTSYEALVLGQGRAFTNGTRAVPRSLLGPLKNCYRNTFRLIVKRPSLTYVEGFAIWGEADFVGIAVNHAWAVDQDGRVLDPTWPHPETSAYFGIPFEKADVRQHIIKTNGAGLLAGDYILGFPLLKTGELFPREAPCP